MSLSKFRGLAWFTLGYMILVILWGAFVRASGSGAGCGDHWPLCNGQIVPRNAGIDTVIELTHRLTSGLALVLVVALFVVSRMAQFRIRPIQSAALWSLVFIVIEALIGAGLVLFKLVGFDESLTRAVSMSAHLLNTFVLLSALSLLTFRLYVPKSDWLLSWADLKNYRPLAVSGLLLILTGMTGAIAALGDTLYSHLGALPLSGYFVDGYPLIMRLRLIHPVVALLTVAVLLTTQVKIQLKAPDKSLLARLGWSVSGLALIETVLGAINVYLMAPIWLQIVHLGTAVMLWIVFSFQCFVFKDSSL
jgi:heme A synthase